MSADLNHIARLADELYKELVKQDHWDGLETIGHFSKASSIEIIENKTKEIEKVKVAFNDLLFYLGQTIKRFRKLDAIHQCLCSDCGKQRNKFNNLLQAYDEEAYIKEIEEKTI
jgi:hypothetical protein